MEPMGYFYLLVTLGMFALGDILAVLTKARLSSVFVALLLFTFGFLFGLFPKDIIALANMSQVAKWATAFIVFHMGTMVNIRELVREWRTVALSVLAMITTIAAILVCIPFVGKESAIVSIPVMKGGLVATQVITTAAMARGMQVAAAFAALVYAIHKFVGTPIASFYGLKEAEIIVKKYREDQSAAALADVKRLTTVAGKEQKKQFYERLGLEKYFTEYTCLGVTALFAWVSILLNEATGLNYSIWSLLLGATLSYFELVPPKILDRAKTSGFLSMATFASIIPAMAGIHLQDIGIMAYQMTVLFGATLISTFLFFYILPLWKIVGSKNLAIGITMANMIGFPANWLVVNEIANAVGTNEKEKDIIMKTIMPAYIIAGFATVTTLSIVIAGVCEKFL
jgi:hypothetical protein